METPTKTSAVPAVEIKELTPENFADYGACGYKDMKKHKELQRKLNWVEKYHPKGLRCKMVVSEKNESQGMIEYLPGELAHRPVKADGYLFIHCLFVGFRKEFKGRGFASQLIDECIKEARQQNKKGVAVVTRKGSFMAKKDIFLKKGFQQVDSAKPDFELLALKFDEHDKNPAFNIPTDKKYGPGVTVIRSAQCPYSVKNVDAILSTAKNMGLKTRLIELEEMESEQSSPCAFGTFCILYNDEIISHHPISNKRFENIMNQKLSK
jgi:ribosomal protein S18 acetylase RimI-like enzyme